MTSRDPMPFGKFKGQPLGSIDKSYADWLCRQDGFATKNPALYKFFTEGEEASSTPDERKTIDLEGPLLDPMPPAFKAFWKRAYGERMRVHGQIQYIAFLRVACETWNECAADERNATGISMPSRSVPDANKPKMLPHPLAHIPAPNRHAMLNQPLPVVDNRDEEVDF